MNCTRTNTKKTTKRHGIIKPLKTGRKIKILKAARKIKDIPDQEIGVTVDSIRNNASQR